MSSASPRAKNPPAPRSVHVSCGDPPENRRQTMYPQDSARQSAIPPLRSLGTLCELRALGTSMIGSRVCQRTIPAHKAAVMAAATRQARIRAPSIGAPGAS